MRWQDLVAIADKLEPRAKAAFLASVERLRGHIDIDRLAALIADGKLTSAEIAADIRPFVEDIQAIADVSQQAFLQSGQATSTSLSGRLGTNALRFDITNPHAVLAAQQLAGRLIVQITDETRAAIRVLISRSYTEGLTARQLARLIRPLIGLTESSTRAVLRYRQAMVELGHTQDEATQLARKYADRKLRERAETIARTELMAASNRGQRALWRIAQDQGLLGPNQKRMWVVTPDDRLCPRCAALDGEIRDIDEPFDEGEDPPLHPSCRCVTVLVFGR